jgi:D-aminoacyl-tRNA deacylase
LRERPDEPGREVRVDACGQLAADRLEELLHPLGGRLREREQHRRFGLVVEQHELLEPVGALPGEPARVGPEEVVEVAERVRVDRGPPTAEPGDDVAVAKLDDTHAASVENRAVRAVVQRVSRAAVRVDGEVVGACGAGLLVLLGVAGGDTEDAAIRCAGKVARLRIFPDDEGRFDRSLLDIGGEALVVSQFTLIADSRRWKGTRPSFSDAAPREVAEPLYERFRDELRALGVHVESGVFGAMMEVELVNDGPVTIILDA